MKAVANVIQERRLLEEVWRFLYAGSFILTRTEDRPSLCGQPALRIPGRRKLFLRLGFDAGRRSAMCVEQ
jgi:hypothetical protein